MFESTSAIKRDFTVTTAWLIFRLFGEPWSSVGSFELILGCSRHAKLTRSFFRMVIGRHCHSMKGKHAPLSPSLQPKCENQTIHFFVSLLLRGRGRVETFPRYLIYPPLPGWAEDRSRSRPAARGPWAFPFFKCFILSCLVAA